MADWVVGVDLGGTKIEVGLVSPENQIVSRRRMPTRPADGARSVVERIAQSVEELAVLLPAGERIAALGICSPGPVDHETGTLIDPPNLYGLHNAPLRQMLSERLKMPVRLEHDAKATALGEFHFGAGQGEQSMVYVIVGTGVGAAVIENGELVRGKYNSAGEVGHVTLDRSGELCACGSRGCVETFLAGPWVAKRYLKALEKGGEALPSEPVTGETVALRAADGDKLARQTMSDAGEALGVAVATMAMLFNIDLFVVGGSVAKSGDLLLEPARRTIPQYSYRSVGCGVHLVATEMGEDGPILGCAWLAREAVRAELAKAQPQIVQVAEQKTEALPEAAREPVSPALAAEMAWLAQVEGMVVDVQRFSVHDGPGIRTNVFLKGCPLRCAWCANPETQRPHAELAFSAQRCVQCGQFEQSCADVWTHGGETLADRERFGQRAERCPGGGMHWLGLRRSAGEVMAEVLRDLPFYGGQGGLTLTGGEPTFQPRMAEALLRLAKAHDLSTAMETSGHTRWKVLERLLPYLDHMLYDLKHLDGDQHRAFTGVDQTLILANLEKLVAMGAPVEIRVPLIPGFNADPRSLGAIADYVLQLEGAEKALTLLPYHTLGRAKYQALGRAYAWDGQERLSDETIAGLVREVEARGLRVSLGG